MKTNSHQFHKRLMAVTFLAASLPARQAYVAAVVDPSERTAAAAYTNTARYMTRPIGPLVGGAALTIALGAPFVIAGAVKSVYDVAFYAMFRRVKVD